MTNKALSPKKQLKEEAHAAAQPHRLTIRLLGGFELRRGDGTTPRMPYEKGRAILAYLLLEPGTLHLRQKLADMFWPDLGSDAARGNLRQVLLSLRQALNGQEDEAPFLVADRLSVRIVPDDRCWVDVAAFAAHLPEPAPQGLAPQLEDLAALYRGELMAGFSLPDCPEFEDWLQIKRESLHRRALHLLERLSNCHEQAAEYEKALPFALRHVELDPWNEEGYRRAMRLFAMSGQGGAALQQYDACCRTLKRELGVLPAEETTLLARRIRAGELQPDSPRRAAPSRLPAWRPHSEERRQVTVLYCELTPLGSDDPDEAMELLKAHQQRCHQLIQRNGGHIVQAHGGGLLAYFGYPQASEHAARQAVRTALALARESAPGLEMRAGVHTGLIITGSDPSVPDTVGATSALAIRLRLVAEGGEVALSASTQRLVAGYIRCESLGLQQLRGIARPLEVFRAIRESGALSRIEAAAKLTPLIGRAFEIATLSRLWHESRQGARHVVLLRGEAGIGKSRLVHALKERLRGERHVLRELRCFPEFRDTPYHPLIAAIESSLGFAPGEAPEARFGKLARYVEQAHAERAATAVPLLAQLLSLPVCAPYRLPESSPQKTRNDINAIALDLLANLASRQPVLLVLEDLHWIDPSTMELLTLFVERKSAAPVLAILTCRPDFQPAWRQSEATVLELPPLAEDEAAAMVGTLAENMAPEVIRQIVARADGIPLFVEEMTCMAALEEQAKIPATLHDLLAARLDGMGADKHTAQLGATIGRQFDVDLLRRICPLDRGALDASLRKLQEAGLVLRETGGTYQFKHALIRDAAYESQTKPARQGAHRKIAQALQAHFPHIADTQPETLAQHLAAGGEFLQAVGYWIRAGEHAARQSSHLEAIAHFKAGLKLLPELPAGAARDEMEFTLQVGLGSALYFSRGLATPEAREAYARAMTLCAADDISPKSYRAMCGLWASATSYSYPVALDLANKLLSLSQQSGDPVQAQQARYSVGSIQFWQGDFEASRAILTDAVARYDPAQHEAMISQFGENVCVVSGSNLALSLWFLGYPDQARQVSRQTLALARQIAHPYSLGYALTYATSLNRWIRSAEAPALGAETLRVAQEYGFATWLGAGALFHGSALVMQGRREGLEQMLRSIDAMRIAIGSAPISTLVSLLNAHRHLGQIHESLAVIDESLALGAAKGDHHAEAEFRRQRGECLLAISPDNAAEAEACFRQALDVSRRQKAKAMELRAAMSMAMLRQHQGKPDEGRRLLEEVYNSFTEGFDTPDLQDAAKLLRWGLAGTSASPAAA